jgi:hypothetical protein
MIGALAEPEALLVFGAIATATSKARLLDEFGRPVSGTCYITPFGLEKKTSLPRDAIERAARRLKRADCWRSSSMNSAVWKLAVRETALSPRRSDRDDRMMVVCDRQAAGCCPGCADRAAGAADQTDTIPETGQQHHQ